MSKKVSVHIRMNEGLLERIDKAAEHYGMNRPSFIRSTLVHAVNRVDSDDYPYGEVADDNIAAIK